VSLPIRLAELKLLEPQNVTGRRATYRKTPSLAADASRVKMPEEMKTRLREFLLSRLREER
jgi:hypothetical protein